MAIQAPPGKLIRLTQVTREVRWLPTGRGGRPMHHSFLVRMAMDGKLVAGQRAKLQTMRVGGALCTCEAWLLEFFNKLSGGSLAGATASGSHTPTPDAEADADAVLSAAGI